MGYGKAVEEVWAWRDALAKELEKVSPEKRAEYINKKADTVCKTYGLKCRIVKRVQATSTHNA
jgi:hypothetical protein